MKKRKNLIVKLTGILMSATVMVSLVGCAKNDPNYMVIEENDQYVVHKNSKPEFNEYNCGCMNYSNDNTVIYKKMPPEHAYDIKCSVCFPEQ